MLTGIPAIEAPTPIELDVARQNAKEDESIIATAYYWYGWAKTAKNVGQLALSATPSGAIKYVAQMAAQPVADKIAEKTGYSQVSTAVRAAIICSDPVGSAISYGMSYAVDKVVNHPQFSDNKHVKALVKVASQEAASRMTVAVKSSETYKAASDTLAQEFKETAVGAKVAAVQKEIDQHCERFDQHEKVQAAVKQGNDVVEKVSKKIENLPGAQTVKTAKQKASRVAKSISQRLENRVTNKIAEKVSELDTVAAKRIRNSRVAKLEARRQAILAPLKQVQAEVQQAQFAKEESEAKHNKWQERARDPEKWQRERAKKRLAEKRAGNAKVREQLTSEEMAAKIARKIEKHRNEIERRSNELQEALGRQSGAESKIKKPLKRISKQIDKNRAHLAQLHYKEVNERLESLLAKQRTLQAELETTKGEDLQQALQGQLAALKKELRGTQEWAESLIRESAEVEGAEADTAAMRDMPALKELRDKNKVIIRVWLPKDSQGFTSQTAATKAAFFRRQRGVAQQLGKTIPDEGIVGHVSLQFSDGEYVSFWPGDSLEGSLSVVKGIFFTEERDIESEGGDPDRVFALYTLDTEAMKAALATMKPAVEAEQLGWTLADNNPLRQMLGWASGWFKSAENSASPPVYEESKSQPTYEEGTSCVGMVNTLLTAGGLDQLLPIPDPTGFVSRSVATSPENIADLLEQAEDTENAVHSETRLLRNIDKARIAVSGLFRRTFGNMASAFWESESKQEESASDESHRDFEGGLDFL